MTGDGLGVIPRVRLRLEIRGPRHSDYEGDPPGFLDWFEDLTLVATDLVSGEETILFQGNWWLGPLLDWLAEIEGPIRNDEPVVAQLPGETIGQTMRRAREMMLAIDNRLFRIDGAWNRFS